MKVWWPHVGPPQVGEVTPVGYPNEVTSNGATPGWWPWVGSFRLLLKVTVAATVYSMMWNFQLGGKVSVIHIVLLLWIDTLYLFNDYDWRQQKQLLQNHFDLGCTKLPILLKWCDTFATLGHTNTTNCHNRLYNNRHWGDVIHMHIGLQTTSMQYICSIGLHNF